MSNYHDNLAGRQKEKSDLNTPALLSFLFAISGLTIPAIVLGHVGFTQMRRRLETGRFWAALGLLLGYLQLLAVIVVVGLYFAGVSGVGAQIIHDLTHVGPETPAPLPSNTLIPR